MSPNSTIDAMYKVVLVGDGAVGKTSIRRNFLGKGFVASHIATIGVDFAQKYVFTGQKTVRLVIWDLSGQTSFERVRKHYYQGCRAIILVYSVVNRETFDNLTRWLAEVYKYNHNIPPTALLGNKVDLRSSELSDYEVSTEEGLQFRDLFVKKLGVPIVFYETSAKTGKNVQDAFSQITRTMLAQDAQKRGAPA